MTLLAPFALWGLLALAVPILLHLRRRRVGRTVHVGSVRHLESLPTAERRGPRLREPWVLLLRALILSILVLLLARPVLDRVSSVVGTVALIDSAAARPLRDSLGDRATLLVERIDDPWRRLQELDDSLPAGIPVIIAASNSSALYSGPRPTVARSVTWIPLVLTRGPTARIATSSQRPDPSSREAGRALAAAVAAVADEFGALADTIGWQQRLPEWWPDSLATTAFPVRVAQALLPARALPPPVELTASQMAPRAGASTRRPASTAELHWWLWALAAGLFFAERLLARRSGGRA